MKAERSGQFSIESHDAGRPDCKIAILVVGEP